MLRFSNALRCTDTIPWIRPYNELYMLLRTKKDIEVSWVCWNYLDCSRYGEKPITYHVFTLHSKPRDLLWSMVYVTIKTVEISRVQHVPICCKMSYNTEKTRWDFMHQKLFTVHRLDGKRDKRLKLTPSEAHRFNLLFIQTLKRLTCLGFSFKSWLNALRDWWDWINTYDG